MTNDERRDSTRRAILFPMKYDVKTADHMEEGLAISRNISLKGMLMAAAQELRVGAPVTVTFHATEQYPSPRSVEGRIVRVDKNASDPDGLWPYMVAVEFGAVASDLEPLLLEISEQQKGWAEDTTVRLQGK